MADSTSGNNKTLIIFTEAYPFVRVSERIFLEPELVRLSGCFDRVVIIPRNRRCDLDEIPELPNVSVSTDWLDSKDFRQKWRMIRFLPSALNIGELKTDPKLKQSLTYRLNAVAMERFLEKWLVRNGIEPEESLFYTYWFDYSTTAIALLKLRKYRHLKVVSRVHSYYETSSVAKSVKRLTARVLDAIFAASDYSRDLLLGLIPDLEKDKVAVSPIGCTGKCVKRSDFQREEVKFFTACRLDKEKSLDKMLELIDALAVARTERIHWIVAGGGDDEGRFKEIVGKNKNANLTVDLRGEIDNQQVHEIYEKEGVDWAFLLSPGEARPVALCEALMHGVPGVANAAGGIPEIIDDESGILLPYNPEKEEFVRGIAPYLDSRYRYTQLAEGARNKWESECNADVLSERFVKRILEVWSIRR